ncbi:hypothetical protein OU415_37320, partial [Saccharopolyspora sp. WRP15-2]|nr:hypothetical protein [Saccharopolyspora oryzae]
GYSVRLRSIGWFAVTALSAVTVLAAVFKSLPTGPPWTPLEHFFGNPYLLCGLLLLGLLGLFVRNRTIASAPEDPSALVGDEVRPEPR